VSKPKPIFRMATSIEFDTQENLEAYIRVLPLPPEDVGNLLDGETVTDTEDKIEFEGAGEVIHTFKTEGVK
jgi:hypothetical protein